MSKRPTRQDVARAAGTSVAVVTYVLNNGPRPVAPETRARVLEAVRAVNYHPNPIAQALASGRTGAFGLVLPNMTNPFIGEIAHAVGAAAHARGRVLLLGDSADDPERERELIASFLERQVDGVIYMGVTEDVALELFEDSRTPVVVFTHADSDGRAPSVRINERRAVRALTEHLMRHGHTSVSMLTGPRDMANSEWRAEGWREALGVGGGAPDESGSRLDYAPYSRVGGYEYLVGAARDGRLPQALVTGNERQAVGVMAAAADLGITIPTELALVALNGSADSGFTVPALTSVRQPFGDMAEAAFAILEKKGSADPEATLFGFDLVAGTSCGCHADLRQDRRLLATWSMPDAGSLDSAAGLPARSPSPAQQRPREDHPNA